MTPQRLTPEQVQKAQTLVSRVRGISSCHITTDGGGDVTEIHVVATGRKSPKLVARDVESVLKAELGLELDHRKIGVVNLEGGGDDETAETVAAAGESRDGAAAQPLAGPAPGLEEFPVEEYASRFAFQSVNVFAARGSVKAEVELTRDSAESFGTWQDDHSVGRPWRVVAEATLRAVSEFLDEGTRLCLIEVLDVVVGERQAFIVGVDLDDGRGTRSLAGCAIDSGNENQAIVFATLDAVNRVVGKLDFKSSIEYRIR